MTPAPTNTRVEPAAGDGLSNNNGGVQLDIPPGAVAEPILVQYAPATPPRPPPGVVILGGFSLTARTDSGQAVTQFGAPLTLRVRYDPAQLGGLPESAIQIYYQTTGGEWVALPTTVDTATRTATAFVDHFTEFAAFASSGGTATPGPTSTPTATPFGTPATGNNSTCEAAQPVAFGETVPDFLQSPGEQRWYTVTVAAGRTPWEITSRLMANAPDLQALLTVNCGQGPAAAALRAPIVPLGQSGRDDQGWRLQARLHQPGV